MRSAKPLADPYRILGIARAADLDQIKAAHRRLAKQFHPDGSTGDERRFLAVQEAYQLLIDQRRRREWDERHAPGPVRAKSAPARPQARPPQAGSPAGNDASPPTSGPGASPPASGPGAPPPSDAARPRRPARDGRSRTRTWSAERVPWWQDFRPGQRGDADAPGRRDGSSGSAAGPEGPADGAAERPAMDFDVFNRSSGAAWSMAARRHFRKGDEDLPSRGAWRYRGTQVVTGAEARKVAAEEAEAEAARRRRATSPVRSSDRPRDDGRSRE